MRLVNVKKLTNERFLNLYDLEYEHEGKIIHWTVASRNKPENLVCVSGKNKPDTVCIIPKVIENGEEYIILTKEYRQPLNDYVYSFPAGLVEEGEDVYECCARELQEEIGAEEISDVNQLTGVCYNSEGMTDESVVVIEVTVTKLGKQNLQDHEDIKVFKVKVKDLPKFVQGKRLSTKAGIYIPMVVQNYELRQQLNNQKKGHQPGEN